MLPNDAEYGVALFLTVDDVPRDNLASSEPPQTLSLPSAPAPPERSVPRA